VDVCVGVWVWGCGCVDVGGWVDMWVGGWGLSPIAPHIISIHTDNMEDL